MNTHPPHASQALPRDTAARLQLLLDQADRAWFTRNPSATYRVRFHFRNEAVEPGKSAQRYVVVTIEAGVLVRRFTGQEATA